MRKVLAITAALMIAAIIVPALGFSIEAAGNQSYSIMSGERIAYTLTAGVPAHNITSGMVADKYSFEAASVSSTRVPYSFNAGAAPKYSFALIGVENAAAQGMKPKEAPALLGSMNKKGTAEAANEAVPAPANETIEPVPANETIEPVPANETIEPVPANETIEPAPANETIEPAPANETIEPVPANETVTALTNATENKTIVVTENVTETITN